jgi:hypothetical protein
MNSAVLQQSKLKLQVQLKPFAVAKGFFLF